MGQGKLGGGICSVVAALSLAEGTAFHNTGLIGENAHFWITAQ